MGVFDERATVFDERGNRSVNGESKSRKSRYYKFLVSRISAIVASRDFKPPAFRPGFGEKIGSSIWNQIISPILPFSHSPILPVAPHRFGCCLSHHFKILRARSVFQRLSFPTFSISKNTFAGYLCSSFQNPSAVCLFSKRPIASFKRLSFLIFFSWK